MAARRSPPAAGGGQPAACRHPPVDQVDGPAEEELAGQKGLRIELKYFEGQPAIQHLARVSKPGRRVYSGSRELPRIRNGLGMTIGSTPRGVLSDAEAREANVGGEVLAEVF